MTTKGPGLYLPVPLGLGRGSCCLCWKNGHGSLPLHCAPRPPSTPSSPPLPSQPPHLTRDLLPFSGAGRVGCEAPRETGALFGYSLRVSDVTFFSFYIIHFRDTHVETCTQLFIMGIHKYTHNGSNDRLETVQMSIRR